MWRAGSGERLGTYDGHTGAVYHLDVNGALRPARGSACAAAAAARVAQPAPAPCVDPLPAPPARPPAANSRLLLTASGDFSVRLWAVETGAELFSFAHAGPAKGVAWEEGDRGFATVSDPFGADVPARINFYAFAEKREEQTDVPRLVVTDAAAPKTRVTRIAWLPFNVALLAAYDDGGMALLDPASGAATRRWHAHDGAVTALSFNAEKTLLVSASKDRSAKLWDVANWAELRAYAADAPLNGAAISPSREHVVAGGGQEAMSVTTSGADAGKFESRFYHMVFGNELGRVKGHFGPINTLAFNPDGRSFATGGEDGYVRLHPLDEGYDRLGEDDDRDLDDSSLAAALADGTLERLEEEEQEAKRKAEAAEAATAAAK